MAYVGLGAFTGNGVIADKTPGSSTDAARVLQLMLDKMADGLGYFMYNDGTPVFNANHKPRPQMSYQHCKAAHEWMIKVAEKMIVQAKIKQRPSGDLSTVIKTYKSRVAGFFALNSFVSIFSERMSFEQVDMFVSELQIFTINMSTAQWTAYNIGTGPEIYDDALSETPGGDIIKGLIAGAKAAADAAAYAASNLDRILKIGFFGGVGFLGYRIYKRTTAP